ATPWRNPEVRAPRTASETPIHRKRCAKRSPYRQPGQSSADSSHESRQESSVDLLGPLPEDCLGEERDPQHSGTGRLEKKREEIRWPSFRCLPRGSQPLMSRLQIREDFAIHFPIRR